MQIKIQVFPHGEGLMGTYAHEGDAGLDLRSAEESFTLHHGETKAVRCGFALEIPQGHVGLICSRSGLAVKNGIFVLNSPGVIDSSFRGELTSILHNTGRTFPVERGMRVAQLLIVPFVTATLQPVEALSETTRGGGGLGSSGLQ